MDSLEIIDWIIRKREEINVSQAVLADLIGLSQSCIAKIELNQRKLTVIEFFDICEALNISEEEVVQFIKKLYSKHRSISIWERNG